MHVLITGGAGYIGTELVHDLARDNKVKKILVYDNLSRKNFNLFIHHPLPRKKVVFIQGELLNSRKLRDVLKEVDVVFHLAAKVTTPFASQDPHFFEQVNHWGTAELVYALEDTPNVSQFVFTSSTSVYGSSGEEAGEETIPNPKTYYGISKLRAEDHVNRLKEKLNTQVIRLGNVYGYSPSMRFDAVINRFMLEANFNHRISVQGNGKQTRAFIHIQKVAEALRQLLHSKVPSGTYNLVDKNISVQEVADHIKELYPSLEMLYVNQHLALRQLMVNPASKIFDHITVPKSDFRSELKAIKRSFTFHPFE